MVNVGVDDPFSYSATASPTPIDSQLADVLAENRNAACSGPGGCLLVSSHTAVRCQTEIPWN